MTTGSLVIVTDPLSPHHQVRGIVVQVHDQLFGRPCPFVIVQPDGKTPDGIIAVRPSQVTTIAGV